MCECPSTLNKARHQRHAMRVDDFSAGAIELAAPGGHRLDALTIDQHIGRIRRGTRSIPNKAVPEQNARDWFPPAVGVQATDPAERRPAG
jgi:hypothetical protein